MFMGLPTRGEFTIPVRCASPISAWQWRRVKEKKEKAALVKGGPIW
jgi:hypothetical protein